MDQRNAGGNPNGQSTEDAQLENEQDGSSVSDEKGNIIDGSFEVTEHGKTKVEKSDENADEDGDTDDEGSGQKAPAKKTEKATTQQDDEKATRHYSRKINQEVEKRVNLALDVLDENPDFIYKLAEKDPAVANRILKTRDVEFNAKNVDELLRNKRFEEAGDDPVKRTVLEQDERLRRIEEAQNESKLRELKARHPDLEGELEEEFRGMYSDPAFKSRYTEDQMVGMARAALGIEAPDEGANSVALDLLNQNAGAMSRMRGGSTKSREDTESPEEVQIREAFGHSKKDEEKYLPKNFDEIMGFGA